MDRDELRRHMKRLGLDAVRLAQALEVTPEAVYRWLGGSRRMHQHTAKLIREMKREAVKA